MLYKHCLMKHQLLRKLLARKTCVQCEAFHICYNFLVSLCFIHRALFSLTVTRVGSSWYSLLVLLAARDLFCTWADSGHCSAAGNPQPCSLHSVPVPPLEQGCCLQRALLCGALLHSSAIAMCFTCTHICFFFPKVVT